MKMKNVRKKRKRKGGGRAALFGLGAAVLLAGGLSAAFFLYIQRDNGEKPQEVLQEYMDCIEAGDYEKMYQMIDPKTSGEISQEDFVQRNSNIYEGIEIQDLQIEIEESQREENAVSYTSTFGTVAGEISFSNTAYFTKTSQGWELAWSDAMIFPELEENDKVRVSSWGAERGKILDRNGRMMAGQGTATSVGLVPMYIEDNTVKELSDLLVMDEETIETMLSASWVKNDSFVPLKTIPKIEELDLIAVNAEEGLLEEYQYQKQLLEIPGVMFQDVQVREYPYKEAAAHLIGYVQNVTAEDLEQHAGEGYRTDSVIGRSGMESLYEKELKGRDGYEIYIQDSAGGKKAILCSRPVENGSDITLTIDAELQEALYEQFKEDQGCSVAMNPYTGEVLALVSTPSFDNNLFVTGMSQEQWDALNEDENTPLYNRFRQVWCPGSAFKPVIAAVGLDTGAIDPSENYGNEGLSWQKDSTWGEYFVTTLHVYEPVNLQNAMMCSDNIYFAKAALKIGAQGLQDSLEKLGFGGELPFEITMTKSQYSNTQTIDSEIQLADSGYGQGQILVNPLHLASLYTMFSNEGNVIQPRLLYEENAQPVVWIEQAISYQAAQEVRNAMDLVVNSANGTGYGAHRDDIALMGKTGTAEIKASQDDVTGTEIGWFAVFTADPQTPKPLLLLSMAEDVKEKGGSGYVVNKDVQVLNQYFSQ